MWYILTQTKSKLNTTRREGAGNMTESLKGIAKQYAARSNRRDNEVYCIVYYENRESNRPGRVQDT